MGQCALPRGSYIRPGREIFFAKRPYNGLQAPSGFTSAVEKSALLVCFRIIVDQCGMLSCAYRQKLLHTNAFRRTPFYTTDVFGPRRCYTHKRFHTQTPLHKYIFAHRRFWTNKRLYTKKHFLHTNNQTEALKYRRFLQTDGFYTQRRLHTDAFTQRSCRFGTQTLVFDT